MAQTLVTTWTRLFGETFEQGYNPDPNNELELTDKEREKFLLKCRNYLETQVDIVLQSYDPSATILANGEIIADLNGVLGGLTDDDWEDIEEEISYISFDNFLP